MSKTTDRTRKSVAFIMTTQHRTIIINLHQNNSQSPTLTFKLKFYKLYVEMVWTAFNLQKALCIWFSKSEPKHVETLGLAFIAIETMVSIIRSVTSLFGLEIFSLRTIYSSEGVLWQGDGGLVCKFMPVMWRTCLWGAFDWNEAWPTRSPVCERVLAGCHRDDARCHDDWMCEGAQHSQTAGCHST